VHILFITDNFPPEVNAPASRTYEHCKEWVARGAKVTLITGFPNFPIGKVFDGYQNSVYSNETMDGIEVRRVWTYIAENKGFLKRTCDYLSFMFAAILASFFVKKVDIIVGTSPQIFTVCAAYIISRIKNSPWVFELRDIWPESIQVVGGIKNLRILKILQALEVILYRKATHIVVVTNSFQRYLEGLGINSQKITVIRNGINLEHFYPRNKCTSLIDRLNLQGKFVVGYIGTIGLAHNLDILLNAAKLFALDHKWQNIQFLIVGEGAEKLKLIQRIKRESIGNVAILDGVSKEDVVNYYSILDAAVIHLKKDPLFEQVIPSKLFELVGQAIPILHGVQGESAQLVEEYGVGVVFSSDDPNSLKMAIESLHDNPNISNQSIANAIKYAPLFDRKQLADEMYKSLFSVSLLGKYNG
jgi:glycosyltransferase involved in cell wall biosynthesis